jgi:hypothetical protein
MIQADDLCCNPSERRCAPGKQSLTATRRSFSCVIGGPSAVHALPDHFPDDRDGFPAASLGGDIRKIEQEFGNVEMIYFPPHNMLHCIGDVDRIEVVRGSGTFTDEIYFFIIS